VLHEFLTTNRPLLIERCRSMVDERSGPRNSDREFAHGVPVFIDQLISILIVEQKTDHSDLALTAKPIVEANAAITATALLHGHELHDQGFTLEQVVRDYGDLCQSVTDLAFKTATLIAVDEFRTFNRCLDNAIAGAVTEYARHGAVAREVVAETLNSRLAPLAHELRNHLHTATLVVAALKMGSVGILSATGAVLDRSLLGMHNLIDRALSEVRVTARMPPRREAIVLSRFLDNMRTAASFDALARGTRFRVEPIEDGIVVCADPEMLAASVGNLLQNAFKFTQPHTLVTLRTKVAGNRVLIEVEDHCGGLPAGAVERMFLPFAQSGSDRSGLGLGLDISRRGVEANDGIVTVRDVPGVGCVFTINLPLSQRSQTDAVSSPT
jgi:signal transduction histidine kinase